MLSRPVITPDLEPYWAAYLYLSRDRPKDNMGMGMGGDLRLPDTISRETIHREGIRRGYAGDALEDFDQIVTGIDDLYYEVNVRRIADEAAVAARQSRQRKR